METLSLGTLASSVCYPSAQNQNKSYITNSIYTHTRIVKWAENFLSHSQTITETSLVVLCNNILADILFSGITCNYTVRDLARTRPNCLLDRQFPENLLYGQANIYMKNFKF